MATTQMMRRIDEQTQRAFEPAGAQGSDPFFSEENLRYVKKSVQQLRAGQGTRHELIEDDDE